MQIDIFTLHFLLIGALLLASAFSLWESGFASARRSELQLASAGYGTIALGCLLLPRMTEAPPFVELTLAPILMFCGYAALHRSLARLLGRRPGYRLPAACAAVAAAWLALGQIIPEPAWSCLNSMFLGLVILATSQMLWSTRRQTGYRSQPLAATVFLVQGGQFLLRTPLLTVAVPNGPWRDMIASATMGTSILFAVVAPVLVVAMIREERESHLIAASRTDFLTGLGNRRAFFDGATRFDRTAGRTLLLVDLDHFKSVNDAHGHDAGDEVLRLFARVAAAELPPKALIARLGGEEFAALLPGGVAPSEAAARRLSGRFAEASARLDCIGGRTVTASVGIAAVPPESDGLAIAMRVADRALYAAKTTGRNRVEVGESGVVVPLPQDPDLRSAALLRARTPWSTAAAASG